MKNALEKIISFPPLFSVLSLLVYAFYSLILGISLTPSIAVCWWMVKWLSGSFSILNLMLFCVAVAFSLFIFFIFALIVFGIAERLLTYGIKPGKYDIGSATFIRWLINGGLHTIALNLIFPYMVGSGWLKLHFRIAGCKMGKNVFLNSKGLHDAYLLTLGNDVVVGGDVNITCHIFEGRSLILENIVIESNTLIGAGSYIMPGVHIGQGCSIGCYSVIRKNRRIDNKSILMSLPGLPVKQIARLIKDSEITPHKVHREQPRYTGGNVSRIR